MRIYFDASALVKAYVREDGTRFVKDVLSLPVEDHAFLSAAHVEPEVISAFAKKLRTRSIGYLRFREARKNFYEDFPDAYHVVPIDSRVLGDASALIRRLGQDRKLTAGDAIHLAAMLKLNRIPSGGGFSFVSADGPLGDHARTMGLHVVNPTEGGLGELREQRGLFD